VLTALRIISSIFMEVNVISVYDRSEIQLVKEMNNSLKFIIEVTRLQVTEIPTFGNTFAVSFLPDNQVLVRYDDPIISRDQRHSLTVHSDLPHEDPNFYSISVMNFDHNYSFVYAQLLGNIHRGWFTREILHLTPGARFTLLTPIVGNPAEHGTLEFDNLIFPDEHFQTQSRRVTSNGVKIPKQGEIAPQLKVKRKTTLTSEKIDAILKRKFEKEAIRKCEDDLLFDSHEYDGKILPTACAEIKRKHVPNILASFKSWKPENSLRRAQDIKWYDDAFRHLKSIKGDWMSDTNLPVVRGLAVTIYNNLPPAVLKDPTTYEKPVPYDLVTHPELYMSPPDTKYFQSYVEKKIVQPPKLTLNAGANDLFDFVADQPNYCATKFLYPKVIKSIIATARKERVFKKLDPSGNLITTSKPGLPLDEIYDIFKKRCPIIEPRALDYKDLAWCVPYIPLEIFHYGYYKQRHLLEWLYDAQRALYSRIISFVAKYYELGTMARSERKAVFKSRSDRFANIMRTPPIQSLFVQGFSKDFIVSHIHMARAKELTRVVKTCDAMTASRKERKAKSSKSKLKSRKEKYAEIPDNQLDEYLDDEPDEKPTYTDECYYDDDFETQSRVRQVFTSIGSFIFWFVAGNFLARHMMPYIVYSIRMSQFGYAKILRLIGFAEAVDEIARDTQEWFQFISDPIRNVVSAKHQPILIEIKSILHAIYYFSKGDTKSALMWLSNLLVTRPEAFVRLTLSNPLWRQAADVRAEPDMFVPQSLPMFDLFQLLTTYFAEIGIKHISDNDIRSANTRFTYLQNRKKQTESIFTTIKSCSSALCRLLFGFDPSDSETQTLLATMIEISSFVDTVNISEHFSNDVPMLRNVLSKSQTGNTILNDPKLSEIHSYIRSRFVSQMARLNVFAKQAVLILKGASSRLEPLFIMLTGPPGVGKSTAIQFLQKAICFFDHIDYDDSLTYSMVSGSPYWEGYSQQKFVSIDDMFKSQAVEDRSEEAMSVIGMVNTVPYSLNMAFGEKGCCFFNSEYIFGTTNLANNGYKSDQWQVGLTDSSAMLRRFHVILHKVTPIEGRPENFEFRVDKCLFDPTLEGKLMSLKELGFAMHELRYIQLSQQKQHDVSTDYIANIYNTPRYPDQQWGVSESKDDESEDPDLASVREDQFEEQSLPIRTINPITFIQELVSCLRRDQLITTTNISLLIGLFLFLVALYNSNTIFTYFFPAERDDDNVLDEEIITGESDPVVPNSWDDRPETGKRVRRLNKEMAEQMQHRLKIRFQTNSSVENFERSLENTVSRSMIRLATRHAEGTSLTGEVCMGIHIRNRFVCVPSHFYSKYLEIPDVILEVVHCNGSYEIPLPRKAVEADGEDFVIFQLPTTCPIPPEAYRYMYSTKDIEYIEPDSRLTILSVDDGSNAKITHTMKHTYSEPISYGFNNNKVIVEYPICHTALTVPGDSGSMIAHMQRQGQPRFYGMHLGVFSTRKLGVGMTLWKEMVDELIQALAPQYAEPFPHEVLRTVTADKAHVVPNQSQLKRTPMYGWSGNPPTRIPAHLKMFKDPDGNIINPLYLAMKKLHQEPTPPTPISRSAIEYLLTMYRPRNTSHIYTPEEALRGVITEECPSIKLATSAGYPYSLGTTKGKFPYIYRDASDELQFSESTLMSIQQDISNLKAGKQIQVLWADVLKDELRPIDKVQSGKTRLFSTCPLNYLIIVRMYFMDLVMCVQKQAATKAISVGISPDSIEWSLLYNRLSTKSASIIAGDFSNYDGRLPKFVGEKFLEFANSWYGDGDENNQIRRLLCEHIWSAQHISFEKIYAVADGNPSGNPITSIYNSFCNIIMCYTILTDDLHLTERDFELAVYGDDNILAVDRPGIKCSTLTPYFKSRFNMDYTHFSKEESEVTDTLHTIRYLGRSFVQGSLGYIRCPLKKTIIEEIPFYSMGDCLVDDVIIDSSASLFREMSHFSEYEFKAFTTKYLSAVQTRMPHLHRVISLRCLTYRAYAQQMYGMHMGPSPLRLQEDMETQSGDYKTRCSKHYADARVHDAVSAQDTNTAREVTQLSANQDVQLGSYADSSEVTAHATNSEIRQTLHSGNNMEIFTLDSSILREYQIATTPWTTSQTQGTMLTYIDFPSALFNQAFIKQKIDDFTYFRAGIRLSVRLAATTFTYGKIIVAYVPDPLNTRFNTVPTSYITLSSYPHMLVSATASEVAVMDVPFISPKRGIRTDTTNVCEMGRFYIMVLHPLFDINAVVNSANLLITAQFLEPELWLPQTVVLQSGRRNLEARAKSASGVVSADKVASVGERALMIFKRTVRPYADLFTSVASTAATVAAAGAIIGLDQPTSVTALQPTLNTTSSEFGVGRGLFSAPKFAMDPENKISVAPTSGGISTDEMDLKYLMCTPMMVYSGGFGPTTPPSKVFNISPFDNNLVYCDFVRRQFMYWSGSLKMKLYITASVQHAIRGVLWMAPSNATTYAWQDTYHRVVDIQGDAEFEFTIPYCSNYVSSDSGSVEYSIWYQTLSWSQPNPSVNTPMFMAIYKAADTDMEVGVYQENQFQTQSMPRADFSQPFEPFHPSFTGYATEGIVFGEKYTSVRDILHRPQAYFQQNAIGFYPYLAGGTNSATVYTGIEMWGLLYQYWCGSMRIRMVRNDQKLTGLFMSFYGQSTPCADFTNPMKPLLHAEVPWYTNLAYQSTTLLPAKQPVLVCPSSTNSYLTKSIGDDFSFRFLGGLPPGILGPVADATKGWNGLATFLAT